MNSRDDFWKPCGLASPIGCPISRRASVRRCSRPGAGRACVLPRNYPRLFPIDGREEEEIDGYPHPGFLRWPTSAAGLNGFRRRLKPGDSRLPSGWRKKVPAWRNRQDALMLEVHHGFFLTMGVNDWKQFTWVIESLIDRPELVLEFMRIEAEMVAVLTERFLSEVQIDAAIFSEPIGGNNGALISPTHVREVRAFQLCAGAGAAEAPWGGYHHPADVCQCARVDPVHAEVWDQLPVGLRDERRSDGLPFPAEGVWHRSCA